MGTPRSNIGWSTTSPLALETIGIYFEYKVSDLYAAVLAAHSIDLGADDVVAAKIGKIQSLLPELRADLERMWSLDNVSNPNDDLRSKVVIDYNAVMDIAWEADERILSITGPLPEMYYRPVVNTLSTIYSQLIAPFPSMPRNVIFFKFEDGQLIEHITPRALTMEE